ncbi:M16 family metallopeptidase [Novosphingobium sp.]|uniref:M16 family metallopeptidase n=1 Tax=Novosphingobium sp. TaxID=1874826 RepID=UPI0035B4C6BA
MRQRKFLFALALSTLALAACAPQVGRPVSAASAAAPAAEPVWAFEQSDVPLDPGFRFGQLPNGMRYVIRSNQTPKGTAVVRMEVGAGSLDEHDDERGYAHFVEHMAFNGSTHVPEGEMIKLLERSGLAFGPDTNASTSYDRTVYSLDLPTNDPALLDTALMLMRETASELTFSPAAVERERGVVQSEMRDRNTYALKNYQDSTEFLRKGSRMAARLPIGTAESLAGATAEGLKAFWRREYVPSAVTLVVIGDFDADAAEAAIRKHFGDWQASSGPAQTQPSAGPISSRGGEAEIYIDPALSEQVVVARAGPWLTEPDTLAQRRENLLREIGYAIINRRLLTRSREANAPFRAASFDTWGIFKAGRSSELRIDTVDGKWRRGMVEAGLEYRRALQFGFSPAEVAEQVAIIRGGLQSAAAGEGSRSNRALFGAVHGLIVDGSVPDKPNNVLARFEAFVPEITPEAVMDALKREAIPLDNPLLRFQGRTPPGGGEAGMRAAWDEAMRTPVQPPATKAATSFGYTDFGPPGKVVSDVRDPALGIREVRFANNVRLNLKRTDLQADQVLVQISLDGGQMLNTPDNPLAVQMVSLGGSSTFTLGGTARHSKDELDTLLAGHTVSAGVAATPETFVIQAATNPRDLELELQLSAAQLTDPGYRSEGQVIFLQNINNLFASLRATPNSALAADMGAILSDGDPRFSLGKVDDYRKLTFAKLRTDMADRIAHGAIEIGIVGDIDEDAAIAMVARTFGALPPREADFRPYPAQRQRSFTKDRQRRVLHHTGAKDQALITMTWPTRDGEDPVAEMELALLQRVVQVDLTDTLREALGKTYSPFSISDPSRTWRGYGTFMIGASVDVGQVPATRTAMHSTIAGLREKPVSDDVLLRARAPLLDSFDNLLKTNGGWLVFVDRAQTEPDRIERYINARKRLEAITPADLQALARHYLTDEGALEISVLPEGTGDPKP